jgi:4-carboxymuconolactone decarboxylase
MANEHRAKGIEMFNEVYCNDLPQPPETGKDRFFDYMLDTVFGQLWADETLSIRDRRLLLLGAIAALGEDMTFTIKARSALKRGEIDREQLHEIVTFLTAYVGYPRGAKMRMAIQTMLAQMEK